MSRPVHFEIQVDDLDRARTSTVTSSAGPSRTGATSPARPTGAPAPATRGRHRWRTPAPRVPGGRGVRRQRGDPHYGRRRLRRHGRADHLRRRSRRARQGGAARDGVAGLLPRHRGQHLRDPRDRRERPLTRLLRVRSGSVRVGPEGHGPRPGATMGPMTTTATRTSLPTRVGRDPVAVRAAASRPRIRRDTASSRTLTAEERGGARLAGAALVLVTLVSLPAAGLLGVHHGSRRGDDAARPRPGLPRRRRPRRRRRLGAARHAPPPGHSPPPPPSS